MHCIKRETLINDLEMVKAGVSPREFIEQSSSFCFQNGEVLTFNDEVACRKKTCLKITGAVQAAALLDILAKIPDDDLEVRENEKGELEFQGKRKRFGVVKDAEIFLPINRVEIPKKWSPLPAEFAEAVDLVQHCVSQDENKFLLTCVHIHTDWIESCNNQQLMRVKIETGLKVPVLVRGTSLIHIASLAMDEISLTESWVHFRNQAGLLYSCRRYAEEYPNMAPILEVKGHPVTIPKGIAEACERASVFAADKSGDALMTVKLKEGRIHISGEGLTGWYKEVKKAAYHGPPLEFLIDPQLLQHISEKYTDAKISANKLKVEGGNWEFVTCLGKKQPKDDGE